MRHLFQSYNALLNEGFARGTADLLGAAPRYGAAVEITGLSAKPELNGTKGVVHGVLDRANGRVAVAADGDAGQRRFALKPENLTVEAKPAAGGAYTAVYEYEAGDCIFIDNLAVAHRATPEAHQPASEVGLRILHRSTIKHMVFF